MRQLRYDVIPHQEGYAIVLAPEEAGTFAAKRDAFDAAVDLARKLRFVGISLDVRELRTEHEPIQHAKAS